MKVGRGRGKDGGGSYGSGLHSRISVLCSWRGILVGRSGYGILFLDQGVRLLCVVGLGLLLMGSLL